MQFKIFNNQILTPLKCGSTYLEMVFPNDIKDVGYEALLNLDNISTLIVREPFDHLQSALHTEILMWYALNPLESLAIDTATPLINNFINSNSNPRGTTHWDVNYYEHLYKFWKSNKDSIKIVHVSNLTPFLKERYDIDIPHDKFSYGIPAHNGRFKYAFISKQKLSKWIETALPELWNDLTKELPKADKFYNLMINGEVSEIYELEEQISELKDYITILENQISELERFEIAALKSKDYITILENQISELERFKISALKTKLI